MKKAGLKHLRKYFSYTLFPPEVIRQARDKLQERSAQAKKDVSLHLTLSNTEYVTEDYDNEDEFFAAYRKDFRYASYKCDSSGSSLRVTVMPLQSTIVGVHEPGTMVDIAAPSRPDALYVLDAFESAAPTCRFQATRSPSKLFIGHGRSAQWRGAKGSSYRSTPTRGHSL